jgi:hypothetical protein
VAVVAEAMTTLVQVERLPQVEGAVEDSTPTLDKELQELSIPVVVVVVLG